ncbi:MAG: acylneuraminate cytidylyltransferase family protein [bacterium]|nr:acylneuraminate cytidylyltransferase family protein [bacterium]
MKYLTIIPARKGSKRIKDKNIKLLQSKPLIYYTINSALKSNLGKSPVIVSTDSRKIAKLSEEYGAEVPFFRSEELATDYASSVGLVLECLDYYKKKGIEFESIVLLQPTSPLRSVSDINEAVKKYQQFNLNALVSVTEVQEHPELMYKIKKEFLEELNIQKEACFKRSQDMSKLYRINGAIYIVKVQDFLKEKSFILEDTGYYIMPYERSIDIDEPVDFKIAEFFLKEKRK